MTIRMLRPRLHSDVVQRAIAMGLNRDSIRTVLVNSIKVSSKYALPFCLPCTLIVRTRKLVYACIDS